ncbi:peptide maturation system acyl carrier-related protein [Clostridium estertheticum]|uniref:peptide maturation system acyl carrier-related protein n=1 Tax=Clostridium estertheticum TaxID=238834 RepID=UPI001C0B26D4|nr:peptide maturation system acyl carrier-related protein [Clostridium estertheticum]MBU3179106.1 peptide maturation system acyl carrier-related protein [Clostridium estertheticum]
MNDFSKNNSINIKLNNIFKNRFDIDLFNNNQDIYINDNLLGNKLSLRARDLMYLLDDVEKEFDITISDDDIDNIKFNTINNIIHIINRGLQQKEIEAI